MGGGSARANGAEGADGPSRRERSGGGDAVRLAGGVRGAAMVPAGARPARAHRAGRVPGRPGRPGRRRGQPPVPAGRGPGGDVRGHRLRARAAGVTRGDGHAGRGGSPRSSGWSRSPSRWRPAASARPGSPPPSATRWARGPATRPGSSRSRPTGSAWTCRPPADGGGGDQRGRGAGSAPRAGDPRAGGQPEDGNPRRLADQVLHRFLIWCGAEFGCPSSSTWGTATATSTCTGATRCC